jgi:hypothetical protein
VETRTDGFSRADYELKLDHTNSPRQAPERAPKRAPQPPQCQEGQWFLRGPIPWGWIAATERLPGKALALGLCLWREAGRRQQRTVKLCLRRPGLTLGRQPAQRALRHLEAAGLVSVLRKAGHGLEVTLLDVPAPSRNGSPGPL